MPLRCLVAVALLAFLLSASASARADDAGDEKLDLQLQAFGHTLKRVAKEMKWTYFDGLGVTLAFTPRFRAAIRMDQDAESAGRSGGQVVLYQYVTPEKAAKDLASSRKTGSFAVGPHPAICDREAAKGWMRSSGIVSFQCGWGNLLVSCRVGKTYTKWDQGVADQDAARAMLEAKELANKMHAAFQAAGLCGDLSPYRIDLSVVRNKDGRPSFPLRIKVQLLTRAADGKYVKAHDIKAPVFLECQQYRDEGADLLGCLTDPSLTPMDNNGPVRMFDGYGETKRFILGDDGSLEIIPLNLACSGEIRKPGVNCARGRFTADYYKIGRLLYRQIGRGDGLHMTVTAHAAVERPGNLSARPATIDDFTVVSAPTEVVLDRIADMIAIFGPEGKQPTAWVRHARSGAVEGPSWKHVTPLDTDKAPYPLQPSDCISLGDRQEVYLHWAGGGTYSFKVNAEALDDEHRVRFYISPTEMQDWADRANYPDSVLKYLSLASTREPVVMIPVKQAPIALVKRLVGLTTSWVGELVKGIVITLVREGINSYEPPGVIRTRLQSSAVYRLGDRVEMFLLEGQLTLLDEKDNPKHILSPNQVLRFDEKGRASPPAAFEASDLPKGAKEMIAESDAAAGAVQARMAESNGDKQTSSLWFLWLVIPAGVLLFAGGFALLLRLRRHKIATG